MRSSRLRPGTARGHAASGTAVVCILAAFVAASAAVPPPGAVQDAHAQAAALDMVEAVPDAADGREHSAYHAYAARSGFARVAAPSQSTESVRFAALGHDLTLSRERALLEDGILSWVGTDGEGGTAVLVVDGSDVLGTVDTAAGGTLLVAAVSDTLHEVLELDPALLPPMGSPDGPGAGGASSSGVDRAQVSRLESAYVGWTDYDGSSGRGAVGSTVTIKVLVAYTGEVARQPTSTASLVQFIEEKANIAYESNDLPVRIDTVSGGTVRYSEASTTGEILEDLVKGSNTGLLRVHSLAEDDEADLVVMMFHPRAGAATSDSEGCGKSQETLAKGASTAFAVVSHACVASNYATAAIGMLQRAGAHDKPNPEFSYGKGYHSRDKRTIMVDGETECNMVGDDETCVQQRIWSDPYRDFHGTQTPAGTVERWNAKAVFAGAPHAASLRGGVQTYDSARPAGAVALPSTIPATGSLPVTATFSEPIHGGFPPNITVTDGIRTTTATMSRSSDTVFTYRHGLDG